MCKCLKKLIKKYEAKKIWAKSPGVYAEINSFIKELIECFMFSNLMWVKIEEIETRTGSYLYSRKLDSKIEITHIKDIEGEDRYTVLCEKVE